MDADRQLLVEEEGVKQQPYYDSKGYVTWGVGHLGDPRKNCPVPMEIVQRMFEVDLAEKRADAERVPGFDRLNDIQKAVIISMVYQMGFTRVLGFRNMVAALQARDFEAAARHGRDSKWWREDTPERAERQMLMLESGLWVPWKATRR